MGDFIIGTVWLFIFGMALRGFGFLFGFGFKERNKCWSSEGYYRRLWLKNKDPRFREYFPEN